MMAEHPGVKQGEPIPARGKDRLGSYVMRCSNCKNGLGVLRGDYVHLEKVRCRSVLPYRASH